MPRWKALPDDLDPQIKEFTVGLRQLVDRSGLDVAALADRTGYGTTSWERYLGGRLLAPKGAVIALAEVTGAPPGPLTTLWELAERAWSRAELRDGSTLQALRIAEGESDPKSAGKGTGPGLGKGVGRAVGKGAEVSAGQGVGKGLGKSVGKGAGKGSGTGGAGTAVAPRSARPGWVSAAIPAQPSARDADTDARDGEADGPESEGGAGTAGRNDTGPAPDGGPARGGGSGRASGSGGGTATDSGSGARATAAGGAVTEGRSGGRTAGGGTVGDGRSGARTADGGRKVSGGSGGAGVPVKNSWGVAGYRGPSPASARPGARPAGRANGAAAATPAAPLGGPAGVDATRPLGAPPAGTAPGPARAPEGRPAPGERSSARRQQVVMFFAGLVGVLALIGGVFYFTHRDGDGPAGAAKSPSPSASAPVGPPPGVKCAGSACTGKDAEAMGCGGEQVTTAKTATVGTTTLEVRYSKVCGTAWGRITSGAPGDTVRVTAGGERQTGDITAVGDTIGYTPMVAVRNAAQARACATLASGQKGCTE
ncbi:helix-turn-helix domain-containing protein [Streptomyces nogalater]|uniref:helix-turn-helix domain-containing protein n=1 Tax=Streptomyces nogalater TaxID=38314 RepID=UPI0031E1154C